MKKLTLSTIALTALFLSACGSGGSSGEKSITAQISERNYVEILREIPLNNRCEDEDFKNLIIGESGATNFIMAEVDATATCTTYNKVEGTNCLIEYYLDSDKGQNSCVLAYDSSYELGASTKIIHSSINTFTSSSIQKF